MQLDSNIFFFFEFLLNKKHETPDIMSQMFWTDE